MIETDIYDMLGRIASRLEAAGVAIPENNRDGRISSGLNEDAVIDAVESIVRSTVQQEGISASFVRAAPRWWFDFAIRITSGERNLLVPVNVKISTLDTPDNINSKLGIFYALSGQEPDCSSSVSWEKFHEILKVAVGVNKDADYYFLVVEKASGLSGRIFMQSMRRLRVICPNGNNMPFQCKWRDNIVPVSRSFDEARDFLISGLGASWDLRAKGQSSFRKHLGHLAGGHV